MTRNSFNYRIEVNEILVSLYCHNSSLFTFCRLTSNTAPQLVPFLHLTPPPQQQSPPPNHQALEPRRLSPSCPVTSLPSIVEYHGSHGQEFVVSPFTIAGDRLIMSAVPSFTRPHNGQVNGYIKFHWPSRTPSRRHSDSVASSSENKMELATQSGRVIHPSRKMSVLETTPPTETAIVSNVSMDTTWTAKPSSERYPVSSNNLLFQMTNTGEPRMLPPQFGSQAKMDHVSRRLFEFCMSIPLSNIPNLVAGIFSGWYSID